MNTTSCTNTTQMYADNSYKEAGQLDSQLLTTDRYAKRAELTAKQSGWGQTDAGLAIARKYITECTEAVTDGRQYLSPTTHRDEINKVPDEIVALVGIDAVINATINELEKGYLLAAVGSCLEDECYAYGLKTWDQDRYDQIMRQVKRDRGKTLFRRRAMRSLAQKAKFPWKKWGFKDRVWAGGWLVSCLLNTSFMVRTEEGHFSLTEEAVGVAERTVEEVQSQHPYLLPLKESPAPWTESHISIHGYRVNLVRGNRPYTQKVIRQGIRDGRMAKPLEALNIAQSVPYRINKAVLDVVQHCYDHDIEVEGLPPRLNIDLPILSNEDAADPQKLAAHRKVRSDLRKLNRSYIGSRIEYRQDIATAKYLAGAPFWTPMNYDYRGRMYGIPRFNFQRQDYVRALFEFDQGQHLTAEGLSWLEIHTANCGDFDKVSKKELAARGHWTRSNWSDLMGYADAPTANLGWTRADKPFQFLAACMALRDHVAGLPVHLSVAFDGSCSGLQHLAAMTRDEDTAALVNLLPGDSPNDVYQGVSDELAATAGNHLSNPKLCEIAQVCLEYGITRSLVKRSVMTYFYSSTQDGMKKQFLSDTMLPLQYEVLQGKREVHPFAHSRDQRVNKRGEHWHSPGLTASEYLSVTVRESIARTAPRPARAMNYLQRIASAISHHGRAVEWHTPLGFPVVMHYTVQVPDKVSLTLYDRGISRRHTTKFYRDTARINKKRARSAIAPCFVHSYDACHLQMVVLDAAAVGITDVSLVHDSFACHPNEASRFRPLIRQAFHDLYDQRDVLADIRAEAVEQLRTYPHASIGKIPQVPTKGSYDLKSILEAEYAFA